VIGDNPPTGTITITPSGPILPNGAFTARVDATDDHGLGSVVARAAGTYCYPCSGGLAGTTSSTTISFRIMPDAVAGSPIDVFADINDLQGHKTTVGPVNVTVAADVTPPVPSSPQPPTSTTVTSGQLVTVSVRATDDVEVVSVDTTVDGTTGPAQKVYDIV